MCSKLYMYLFYFSILVIYHVTAEFDSEKSFSNETGITGGENASISHFPYAASISVKGKLIGAGALLTRDWLLTSASLRIIAAPHDVTIRVSSNFAHSHGCELKVAKWINHPQYRGYINNDLALIKFKRPIPSRCKTKSVQFISSTLPQDGQTLDVVGWGWGMNQSSSSKLSSTKVPFMSYKSCKTVYSINKHFTTSSFCTNGKTGPCEYDIGAPLTSKRNIVGVYSTSYICGDPKFPTIYTDVTKFKNWIKTTIRKN